MTTLSPINRPLVPSSGRILRERWNHPEARHEFIALACPEEVDGGYSVFALNYADVMSQGETIEEAKANIAEAFLAVLESRRKHGEKMKFSITPIVDVPSNCERLRITVNG